jgi:hypothetical protein
MSRLKNKTWQMAAFVSFALMLTGLSEANARGGGHGGGGGHSSVSRSTSGSVGGGSRQGFYPTSAALNMPSPKVHTSSYRGGRGYGGGGRGGYGNYNNNYGNPENYYQQPGPVNGQVFSGSAHITPSEYGRYVQTYQWPSNQP